MGHALLICNKCMRIKLEVKLTNSIIGISPQIYSKYHNNTLNISHHDSYKEKIGYSDHRMLNRDYFCQIMVQNMCSTNFTAIGGNIYMQVLNRFPCQSDLTESLFYNSLRWCLSNE